MTFHQLSRAIGFYLDVCCGFLGLVVIFVSLAARNDDNPLVLALGIQLATQLLGVVQFIIRLSSDVESYLGAMGRCLDYTLLKKEAALSCKKQISKAVIQAAPNKIMP